MILGQGVPYNYRMPFRRPADAGNYTPRLPNTAFYSHIDPMRTMLPMASFRPRLPNVPGLIRPSVAPTSNPMAPVAPPVAPDVPGTPPTVNGAFGFSTRFPGPPRGWMLGQDGAAPAPTAPTPANAPPAAVAAMTRRTRAYSPYDSMNIFAARTMRTAVWPHIETTPRGIRAGVANAAEMVNRSRWATFNNRREITGAINPEAAY